MRRLTIITLGVLAVPAVACANPVVLGAPTFVTFWAIVFFALVVESGIAALITTFSGVSPVPMFVGLLAANFIVYFFGFLPVLEADKLPLPALECAVIAVDATFIKLLSAMDTFQGDSFIRLSWLRALLAAGAGNAFSYFVGRVGSSPS